METRSCVFSALGGRARPVITAALLYNEGMARILLLPCFVLGLPVCRAADLPDQGISAAVSFPLDLAIVDPDAKEKCPPYVVVFAGGFDKNETDIRGPIGRLEALRGASRLFPESNIDPGLPVVLRGLRFHCSRNSQGAVTGYEVELQGEFNMVKVPLNPKDMESFLAGQRMTFALKGTKNYGVYSYVSSINM